MSNLALALESGKWGLHSDEGLALKLYRRAGVRAPPRPHWHLQAAQALCRTWDSADMG
jgi:hypothetical protein